MSHDKSNMEKSFRVKQEWYVNSIKREMTSLKFVAKNDSEMIELMEQMNSTIGEMEQLINQRKQ